MEECFAKGSPVAEFNIKDDIVLNIHDCNLHPFFQWRSESTLWITFDQSAHFPQILAIFNKRFNFVSTTFLS
jgi:hypothetical protein